MMKAFKAKRKNPNVNIVIGIVNTVSIGFKKVFKKAKTTATFNAEK